MSRRLHVLIPDEDHAVLQPLAREDGLTVQEWVRRAVRGARDRRTDPALGSALAAIDAAYRHSFPTADIDQMLDEIERGHRGDARDPVGCQVTSSTSMS